jgi:hypothetical protein
MSKSFFKMFAVFFMFVFAASLNAGTMEKEGKAWLDAQKDPAAVNVSGDWSSNAFGALNLSQIAGTREVTGKGGGYQLTGVVSGRKLYLLFATGHGTVDYCAVLVSDSDNSLTGSYSNRQTRLRFGGGLCQDKSRSFNLKKK